MLYLTRKIGQAIMINEDIEVTVVEIRGKSVKLGFTFPATASVLRKEVHEKIKAENIAAASGPMQFLDAAMPAAPAKSKP